MNQSPSPSKKYASVSPNVPTQTTYTWEGIQQEILNDKRVARQEWTEAACIYLRDGILRIMRGNVEHNLIVSEADMRATDWYIVY